MSVKSSKNESVTANVSASVPVKEDGKKKRNTAQGVTSLRASVSDNTFEWFNNAEKVSGLERGFLIEMAMLALKATNEETRVKLVEQVNSLRAKPSTNRMSF